MEFEWDERKNLANKRKHGLSFEEAIGIFNGPVFMAEDDRFDYGERREVSIGSLGSDVVLVVVHTERAGKVRIVSARKARPKERRTYYEHLQETA